MTAAARHPKIDTARLGRLAARFVAARGTTPRVFGDAARLGRKGWQDLRAGRDIPALAWLRVCRTLEVDPVTLRAPAPGMPPFRGAIYWEHFGVGIEGNRVLRGLSLREAAPQIGVSTATLSDAENGRKVNARSYLRICAWLGRHPHEDTVPEPGAEPVAPEPDAEADSNEINVLDRVSPVKQGRET